MDADFREASVALVDRIRILISIIANTPEASPELLAAADGVRIKSDTLDRLIQRKQSDSAALAVGGDQ